MAILESIRRQTTVLILIIGLALFAFVVSGVFTNDGLGGGKVGSSIGEVNGEEISIDDFRQKVDIASRNTGPNASTMQTVNQVWEQEVRNAIMGGQFEDLGVNIEQDQIMNYVGTIPGYAQNPQFQDDNGVFDPNKFRNFIADLKVNNPAQYRFWLQNEASIIQSAKEQTYFNLIKAGIGATLKEGKLDYRLGNTKMDIKYVRVPYASIPDSSITVSKSEIRSYIEEYKENFKQEAARDIQFVYFEEKPSPEDEQEVKDAITQLMDNTVEYNDQNDANDTIHGFRGTTDMAAFLDRHSDIKFDTVYQTKNQLPSQFADTLMGLQAGEIFGPYRDGDYYKVSKMMDRKSGGSVKAGHILITYEGSQGADPEVTRTKEEAEAEAKGLLREARKEDTQFAALARDNSEGPSAPNGGDLGYFQEGRMVPEFNDFAFGNPVGTIGMVETDFGFHVVKIDDKRDIAQIATLAREMEPSEGTVNQLFTDATQFEMESISSDKAFSDLAKEKKYSVRPVNKVKATDENLPGLSSQRSIVQWAFNEDTEIGDIKRFDLTEGYAVVQLTDSYEEGLMSVEEASPTVLPKIRKERKAAQIISANKGKSIEEIAESTNVSTSTASALTVKSPTIAGSGSEPAVVGAAFAMKEGETSELVEGNTGVFKITVTKKTEAPELDNYSTYASSVERTRKGQVNTEVYQALKEASEIEDNRAVFY